jgi:hypothetical protein
MSRVADEQNASKRARKPRPNQDKVVWLGFVEISLTDDDKAALSEMNIADGPLFDFVEEMVGDGYKVSFSEDTAHTCYIASATGQKLGNPNAGHSLSGRGPSIFGALACLAYKHVTLCKSGEWSAYAGSTTSSKWG